MARRKRNLKEEFEPQTDGEGHVMPAFCGDEVVGSSFSRRETKDSPDKTYPNLTNFASPFNIHGNYIDARLAIDLTIKAYWAFPLLRNVIEVMVELANSQLYLKGGNKRTRDFVNGWFKKIGVWKLKEQFLREWLRSANCFVYRLDGEYAEEDRQKLTQVFGAEVSKTIPVKYVILNPQQISAEGGLNFSSPVYFKNLTPYEIDVIRKNTEEAQRFGFTQENIAAIKRGSPVTLKLAPEKLRVVLYKAQPYEPMGVPMAYGVLDDIEAKLEFKRIDLAVGRAVDKAILHFTVGETPTEYHSEGNHINHQTIAAMQTLLNTSSISRTLVTDYTVKGDWLIPDFSEILGPEKYEQLDKDINAGLNAIIFDSGEKFSNTSIKIQVFLERLKEAQNAFINEFLQPEIIELCKGIGAKNYPEASFKEVSMADPLEANKFYSSLAGLGLITAEEMFEAIDSGKMPTVEESVESQKRFKALKESGYYEPLVGGSSQIQREQLASQERLAAQAQKATAAIPITSKAPKQNGRPKGAKAPQKVARAPRQTGAASLDPERFKANFQAISALQNTVDSLVCKKFGVAQPGIAKILVENIVCNEAQDTWQAQASAYLNAPKEIPVEIEQEITDLQLVHDIPHYEATILRTCLL